MFFSVSHPQTNGQVELTNKVIFNSLKKKIKEAKSKWVELLNQILWAYMTTTKTSTGETPFLFTYRTKLKP